MNEVEGSRSGLALAEDRLSWIFGSSRSGSTWLLHMLSEFEGVVGIDDPHLGHHLGVWRPIPLAWATASEPPELTTLLGLKAEEPDYFFSQRYRDGWWEPLRALIRARFEAQGSDQGLTRPPTYVVKEPASQVAPLLSELFPCSKLIFLLRDGRDVVDSWLSGYQKGSWAIPGGAFPVSAEGRLPLIRWLAAVWVHRSHAVRRAFEACAEGDRLLVRYEDLRERTAEVLEEICSMLGLEAQRVAEVAEHHRFERVPAAVRGPRQKVRAASPGSWREHLAPREQEVLQAVLGDALEEFGYELEPTRRIIAAVS
jgi:Sulfotransferase family